MTNVVPYYLLACDTNDIVRYAYLRGDRFSCPRCGAALLYLCHIENISVCRCLNRVADASIPPISRSPSHGDDQLYQDQNEPSINHTRSEYRMSTIEDIQDAIENVSSYISDAMSSADDAANTAGYARDAAENAEATLDQVRADLSELSGGENHRAVLEEIQNIIRLALQR